MNIGVSVPIGSVIAYAGQVAPPEGGPAPIEAAGWMVCDGRTLEAAEYPELFAALGYLYGGSAGQFRIPDYRGYFLRGVDAGRCADPDAAVRAPAPGGTPEGVGSTQASALQQHGHGYVESIESDYSAEEGPLGLMVNYDAVTGGVAPPAGVSQGETRPVNIYVNYIIKLASQIATPAMVR